MSKSPYQGRNRQEELLRVAEQAAEWLITLEDDPTSQNEDLARWLLESPLHTEMFLRAAAIDRKGSTLHPAVLKRLMDRLEMEPNDNVVPFQGLMSSARRVTPHRKRVFKWWQAAAACLVLAGASLWIFELWDTGWERYATDIGEQRSITLQDGSVLHINTHSRVDVRYTDRGRDFRLMEGEALFTVHRDSLRPFRVHVGDTVVRALGTQFNVYRRAGDTTVSVIEGVVQISSDLAGNERKAVRTTLPSETNGKPGPQNVAKRLAAGQAVTLRSSGEIKQASVDVAQATAWRNGELVFERASLRDIVTEFNRYNRKPRLRVDERIEGGNRYTAVFNANEPEMLLKFLEKDSSLTLTAEGDELIIEPR